MAGRPLRRARLAREAAARAKARLRRKRNKGGGFIAGAKRAGAVVKKIHTFPLQVLVQQLGPEKTVDYVVTALVAAQIPPTVSRPLVKMAVKQVGGDGGQQADGARDAGVYSINPKQVALPFRNPQHVSGSAKKWWAWGYAGAGRTFELGPFRTKQEARQAALHAMSATYSGYTVFVSKGRAGIGAEAVNVNPQRGKVQRRRPKRGTIARPRRNPSYTFNIGNVVVRTFPESRVPAVYVKGFQDDLGGRERLRAAFVAHSGMRQRGRVEVEYMPDSTTVDVRPELTGELAALIVARLSARRDESVQWRARTNPTPRRNHHLKIGDRVSFTARISAADAAKWLRPRTGEHGTVVEALPPDFYSVRWDAAGLERNLAGHALKKVNPRSTARSNRYSATRGTYVGTFPRSTDVQTVLFPVEKYTIASARRWLDQHGFKFGKVDAARGRARYHRFRQFPPSDYTRGTLRTIEFGDSGIKAVVGMPKRGA